MLRATSLVTFCPTFLGRSDISRITSVTRESIRWRDYKHVAYTANYRPSFVYLITIMTRSVSQSKFNIDRKRCSILFSAIISKIVPALHDVLCMRRRKPYAYIYYRRAVRIIDQYVFSKSKLSTTTNTIAIIPRLMLFPDKKLELSFISTV